MLEQFFPLGISHYLIGGIIIGVGLSFIYFFTGIAAGCSTFYSSTLSYVSKLPFFQDEKLVSSRTWRLIFALGLILGAVLFTFGFNNGEQFITEVQPWRLAVGGLLVGVGTRLGSGCTSGHGICGLAQFSKYSLISVVLFLAVAIIVATITNMAGIVP